MPEGTAVDRTYKALLKEGHSEESAARIAQAQTGEALATGKPPKHKEENCSAEFENGRTRALNHIMNRAEKVGIKIENITKNQIEKKLRDVGIPITDDIKISGDEVEVCVGYSESAGRGQCDIRKTKALADKVSKAIGSQSSFSTGYGARILQPGKGLDMGDWNDKSSRHHY